MCTKRGKTQHQKYTVHFFLLFSDAAVNIIKKEKKKKTTKKKQYMIQLDLIFRPTIKNENTEMKGVHIFFRDSSTLASSL